MADLGGFLGSAGIGSAIGQAVVQLELDTKKYQAELAAAEGRTVAGTSKMSSALSTFGSVAKAGIGVAALGVVAFGANAVKAASDLGEAVNKSNVIFGNNAKAIEQWAETGADAFGLSKTASLDAAAGFGAMLETAGIATDDLDDMSKSMVQLAGDMASFNNIDPTEALEKLRSGLAGEAEPLRRFGVFLSEAAVQQEAYASGIAKVGEELTEAQKVQARYNIIFEQTTKQQGDFARTADSLPNQLRTMRAEFENISAEVGTRLLPAMTDVLGAVKNLLPILTFLGDHILAVGAALTAFYIGSKAAAAGATNFGAALGPVTLVVVGLMEAGKALNDAFYGADLSLEEVTATVSGQLKPALDAGTISVEQYTEASKAIREGGFENVEILLEVAAALEKEQIALEKEAAAKAGAKAAADSYVQAQQNSAVATEETEKAILSFANKTGDELKDWKATTKESFNSFVFALEDVSSESGITADDFKTAINEMLADARRLSRAMAELKDERWINDDFIAFLSEQGPEWLIAFANTNETQQRRMQEKWEETNKLTDKTNTNFDKMVRTLGDLDQGTSRHTVIIDYQYEGFDPSKPGMGNNTPSETRRP